MRVCAKTLLSFFNAWRLTFTAGYDVTPHQRLESQRRGPLTPIVSAGRACEVAILNAQLPDTVHSQLLELVATRVTTSWLGCLLDAPLYLSPEKAQSIYVALMQDCREY